MANADAMTSQAVFGDIGGCQLAGAIAECAPQPTSTTPVPPAETTGVYEVFKPCPLCTSFTCCTEEIDRTDTNSDWIGC